MFLLLGAPLSRWLHTQWPSVLEDNHLSLARKCFRLRDAGGEGKFPVVRCSLLVAMSSADKRPLMSPV